MSCPIHFLALSLLRKAEGYFQYVQNQPMGAAVPRESTRVCGYDVRFLQSTISLEPVHEIRGSAMRRAFDV